MFTVNSSLSVCGGMRLGQAVRQSRLPQGTAGNCSRYHLCVHFPTVAAHMCLSSRSTASRRNSAEPPPPQRQLLMLPNQRCA